MDRAARDRAAARASLPGVRRPDRGAGPWRRSSPRTAPGTSASTRSWAGSRSRRVHRRCRDHPPAESARRTEVRRRAAAGIVRIAAFGDSFVHGDEVVTDETWGGARARVPGDGCSTRRRRLRARPGAAALRARRCGEEAADRPLGVITDDVLRGVNVFRPFFAPTTGHVLTKPRFCSTAPASSPARMRPSRRPGAEAARHLRHRLRAAGERRGRSTRRVGASRSAAGGDAPPPGEGERQIRHGELNLDAAIASRSRCCTVRRTRRTNGFRAAGRAVPRSHIRWREGRAITTVRCATSSGGIPVVDVLRRLDALARAGRRRRSCDASTTRHWGKRAGGEGPARARRFSGEGGTDGAVAP